VTRLARLALAAACLTLTSSAPAWAEATPAKRAEAKVHFENGQRAFDVGKFDDAAKEFVATYELIGDPLLLYNIAQAYRLGEKPKDALFFYKRYLSRVADSPLRKEVQKRVDELSQLLSLRETTTKAKPTGVIKPGDPHGVSEPEEPDVKPEKKPEQKSATTEPPKDEPPKEEQPPADENAPSKKLLFLGIGAAGLGVIAAGVGVAMSVLAMARSADLERAAMMHGTFDSNLQAAESRGKTYDVVSIPCYIVAGLGVAAGAALIVLWKRSAGATEEPPAEPTAMIAPILSPREGGLALTGRF
jgi:hypothetical protein